MRLSEMSFSLLVLVSKKDKDLDLCGAISHYKQNAYQLGATEITRG